MTMVRITAGLLIPELFNALVNFTFLSFCSGVPSIDIYNIMKYSLKSMTLSPLESYIRKKWDFASPIYKFSMKIVTIYNCHFNDKKRIYTGSSFRKFSLEIIPLGYSFINSSYISLIVSLDIPV